MEPGLTATPSDSVEVRVPETITIFFASPATAAVSAARVVTVVTVPPLPPVVPPFWVANYIPRLCKCLVVQRPESQTYTSGGNSAVSGNSALADG